MASKKDGYSFDDIQRSGDEIREEYELTVKRIYPSKVVKINGKNVDIGKNRQMWYQKIYDYALNPNDPALLSLVFLIDLSDKYDLYLEDKNTPFGLYWLKMIKYDFQLGKEFRLTMDQTKNELTRLGTRK